MLIVASTAGKDREFDSKNKSLIGWYKRINKATFRGDSGMNGIGECGATILESWKTRFVYKILKNKLVVENFCFILKHSNLHVNKSSKTQRTITMLKTKFTKLLVDYWTKKLTNCSLSIKSSLSWWKIRSLAMMRICTHLKSDKKWAYQLLQTLFQKSS